MDISYIDSYLKAIRSLIEKVKMEKDDNLFLDLENILLDAIELLEEQKLKIKWRETNEEN